MKSSLNFMISGIRVLLKLHTLGYQTIEEFERNNYKLKTQHSLTNCLLWLGKSTFTFDTK
jgi:hypothetical protein